MTQNFPCPKSGQLAQSSGPLASDCPLRAFVSPSISGGSVIELISQVLIDQGKHGGEYLAQHLAPKCPKVRWELWLLGGRIDGGQLGHLRTDSESPAWDPGAGLHQGSQLLIMADGPCLLLTIL